MLITIPEKRLTEWMKETGYNPNDKEKNKQTMKEFDEVLTRYLEEKRNELLKESSKKVFDFKDIKEIIEKEENECSRMKN